MNVRRMLLGSAISLVCIISVTFAYNNTNIKQQALTAMKAYNVPVVGYAIIKNHRVVEAQTLSIDPKIRVSKSSIFQAASISKSLSAYAALYYVARDKINLDTPVNDYLTTWKIPENNFDKTSPVTLREILSMTSGLSVSGFSGYMNGEPLPTLAEILDGIPPANNQPIRVFYRSGSKYFYSGGGFQVLQQLLTDVTQQPFEEIMNTKILKRLRMNNSVFQFPLSRKYRSRAVPGFLANGTKVPGGWNDYAIAAAGGMWTTPSDLAKFMINVTKGYLGQVNGIVNLKTARQMLTRQKNSSFGLGVVVNSHRSSLNFRKSGHNLGYQSRMMMFPDSGNGVVIMTDSENGLDVINYIMPIIAYKYHWQCYFPYFGESTRIPEYAC